MLRSGFGPRADFRTQLNIFVQTSGPDDVHLVNTQTILVSPGAVAEYHETLGQVQSLGVQQNVLVQGAGCSSLGCGAWRKAKLPMGNTLRHPERTEPVGSTSVKNQLGCATRRQIPKVAAADLAATTAKRYWPKTKISTAKS